ncbi:ribonuclease HII [Lentisalinibacter sediminis]|uniref:ribonuclease HII n=1 Tax=Lentisalinibacter sediminis TaxID=2992237 RepID=UPI003868CF35
MPARTPLPKWPTLSIEREFEGRVCGIDEAGYAPIAGPVVAAAVVLPPGAKPRRLRGLTDSKLLSADQRERFRDIILGLGDAAVGMASVEEVDRLNIYRANLLAMQRAVSALGLPPDAAIVDGRAAPQLDCRVRTVVKGDRRSLSVAAASVIAKVARDRLMRELAAECPGYGWETNVGYGTDEHYLGLLRHGPTPHHRRSFAPLTTLFAPGGSGVARFRFEASERIAEPRRLQLLELRQDLHAVFDAVGCHIGQVKNLRGHWTFQAVGYAEEGRPVPGGGPCAACHGERLSAPVAAAVAELLVARLG